MPTLSEFLNTALAVFIILAILLIIVQLYNTYRMTKHRKKFEEVHIAIKPGKEVLLSSGLYGKIKAVNDDYVRIEIAKDVEVKASRYSIQEVIE